MQPLEVFVTVNVYVPGADAIGCAMFALSKPIVGDHE